MVILGSDMAKNIEININTNGTAYEALYPKTLAGNIQAGTFSGNFTFANSVVFNVLPTSSGTPSSATQLTTKKYVDTLVASQSSSVPRYNVLVDATTITMTGSRAYANFNVPVGYEIAAFSIQDVSGPSEVSSLYNPINVCWKDIDSQSGLYSYSEKLSIKNTSSKAYIDGSSISLDKTLGAAGRIFTIIAFMRKTN